MTCLTMFVSEAIWFLFGELCHGYCHTTKAVEEVARTSRP